MRKQLTNDYQEFLIKSLKNKEERLYYLNASLDDEDPQSLSIAFQNVVEAQGGIKKLTKKTKLKKSDFHQFLSTKCAKEIWYLRKIVNALGMDLRLVAIR